MRTTARTTISMDPALLAILAPWRERAGWPGFSTLLDGEVRRWLRAQGVEVPAPPEREPLHVLAERARLERQKPVAKKKRRPRSTKP